jgi:PHD/YefM family antitoxin component YafN of YafNO toxin-antitoxin module
MTTLAASKTRIPPDAFNRVAYGGERIRVERRGAPAVAIVSIQDLELLEYLEDRLDIEAAEKALANMKKKGEQPADWEDVKARLGL